MCVEGYRETAESGYAAEENGGPDVGQEYIRLHQLDRRFRSRNGRPQALHRSGEFHSGFEENCHHFPRHFDISAADEQLDRSVPIENSNRLCTISIECGAVAGEMDRLGKAMECKHQHMRVFDKYDLPYRLHSVHSTRIPSLMLDVDLTWRTFFRKDPLWNSGGSHGWDNLYQEMQAIFVAHGPSFKSNYVAKPFENVQLYNLMCALVDVSPAANNGTWGALHHLLTDPPAVELDGNIGGMPQILRLDDGYDFIAYDRSQDMCNNLNDYVQTETSSEEYINDNVPAFFFLYISFFLTKVSMFVLYFRTTTVSICSTIRRRSRISCSTSTPR